MRLSLTRGRSRSRTLAVFAIAAALVVTLLSAITTPTPARAMDLPPSILEGGFIISDAEFYDSTSMTEAQIQTFLDARVPTCRATTGPTCLKSFRADLPAKAADAYCKAVAAKPNATAAHIIWAAATACGINPRVILVMLQKEQGLVTSTAPVEWSYRAAMGQSCPDTPAGCSAAAAGFVNQVYLGARQQQLYTKNPNSYNHKAGQISTIRWHTTASCGTSRVFIQNQATANLYNYTPYRPNVASIAAGSGTGDSCSTYGNRNFYNYYVAWFAPGTSAPVDACLQPVPADIAAQSGNATMKDVSASARNARTAPTLRCTTGLTTLAPGTAVTVTGAYGSWTRATVGGATVWLTTSSLDSTVTGTPAGTTDACAMPAATSIAAASGFAAVTTGTLNARLAPSTACTTGTVQIGQGEVYARTGVYGAWWRLTIAGKTYWSHSDYLTDAVVTPAPPISGTAKAGQILTANTGTWSPKPSAFAYQWKRAGAAIAGATASTYRVTNDDAGKALTVTVTGNVPGQGNVAQTSAAVTPTGFATVRLSGEDRYATATAVSRTAFPNGARTVYLVSGSEFADALAASPLAASQGAALLLTAPKALPAAVATELTRLAPTRVILVGGTTAIDSAMAGRITSLLGSGVAVSRIGGVDRYETSRLIAATWSGVDTAYVATGVHFADALGAAAVAGTKKAPILLVKGDGRDAGVKTIESLATLKATKVVLVGGEAALSKEIAAQFTAAKLSVTRYGGIDRYATNAALNAASYGTPVGSVVVATGTDFPDALAGSLLAASSASPIFVTQGTCATGSLGDFLATRGVGSVTLIGGADALSGDVARLKRC